MVSFPTRRSIELAELAGYAGNFRVTLEQAGGRIADVTKVIPRAMSVQGKPNEFVQIYSASLKNAPAFGLAYVMPGVGIPIEARIAASLNDAEMIVKVRARLEGYEQDKVVSQDDWGNARQWKQLREASIEAVVEELERLKNL